MKLMVLLLFMLSFSFGYAQNNSSDITNKTADDQHEELELVKRKVKKSESEARKAKKEEAKKRREEKLKSDLNSKTRAIDKKEKQLEKIKNQLEKGKLKGILSPVDIQKKNDKILKLQSALEKEQEKLRKLKRKM